MSDQPVTTAKPSSRFANGREFDPAPYLRQIRGRGGQPNDYLDVRHRLLWLRTVHPDAQITTELIQVDDRHAVFKAHVGIPDGGSATGHGSETVADFGDYVEKAETKALGRALNALGFGAQFAEPDPDELAATPARQRLQTPPRASSPAHTDTKATREEWTFFWEWVKSNGLNGKPDVEKILGRSIEGLSPVEMQKLLAPQLQGLAATA